MPSQLTIRRISKLPKDFNPVVLQKRKEQTLEILKSKRLLLNGYAKERGYQRADKNPRFLLT